MQLKSRFGEQVIFAFVALTTEYVCILKLILHMPPQRQGCLRTKYFHSLKIKNIQNLVDHKFFCNHVDYYKQTYLS